MKTISYDFQGWPVNAMTLWEILEELGFRKENGKIVGEINEDLLNAYPRTFHDDGMGYGVDKGFISEISKDIFEDDDLRVPTFNIFRQEYRPDIIERIEGIDEDNEINQSIL